MAKRSRRRPSRHERDQAGCIWGLISIFDFRNGRSTKRLLDRKQESKQLVGAESSSNQEVVPGQSGNCESREDAEKGKMTVPMADVSKTSVKELMEEEMINEEGSENHPNDSEMGLEKRNSNYENRLKKHQKKRNRCRSKSSDMDVSQLDLITENPKQVPNQRPSDNLDLGKILKEWAEINERNTNSLKHDLHSDLDIPSDETMTVVEEKLVTAIKLFIEQRLSGSKRFGEEGNQRCSREFMDALRTLSSNEGLYLKLLQDPDSKLVEHVQNLEDARLGRDQTPSSLSVSRLSEERSAISKPDQSNGRKPRNFFRRRSKSMESYPLGGEKDVESANKIVILKPGPTGAQSPGSNRMVSSLQLRSHNQDNKLQNEKNTSQFSFTEIKRKLRNAMGKERQEVSADTPTLKYSPKHQNGNNGEKGSAGENFGWSSPNRNHKYMEKFLISSPSFKKGEPVGKLKDNSSAVVNETCQNPRFGGSNIYIEAKKHLSEMLMNGDGNPESMTGQLPKPLGRILSLPEYKGSSCCSPRKYGDDIFITAQMRLSPRSIVKNDVSGPLQENDNNHPSPRRRNLESQPGISGNNEDKVGSLDMDYNIPIRDDQECSLEVESFTQDATVPEVKSSPSIVAEIEEMTESRPQEEEISKASNNLIRGDFEEEDTGEVDNTEIAPQFFKEFSPCFESSLLGEEQILSTSAVSPSRCPVSSEVEDSDCAIEKMERPSPVSVLEPIFTDDDISPASTISQPVGKELQPRCIHFEEPSDQGICTRISFEDEESAFEYVEAVLLGSGLNWDEFLMRWLSTYEILDSSLFDEVELFSSRPRYDQKFLFDCANIALKEVCDIYFGCYSGISCVKLNSQPPPKGMDLIQEIWQRVERLLLQHPHPHSLDHLVKTDLARSRNWMNLQSDIELIVFEMEEIIFIELVEEIVPSFVDDTFELPVLEAESNASEIANS
ncbi:hypothetical protein ACS0TY_019407 [Phlomoides rotata]